MSCRLSRWSVVVFLAASLAACSCGSSIGAEDADDVFAPIPEPAAKPEPKKKRNAMVTVLRALHKQFRDVQPGDDMFADPFAADAPTPVAKPAPSKPMPPVPRFTARPRVIWPAGETAADPFLEPEGQPRPETRPAEIGPLPRAESDGPHRIQGPLPGADRWVDPTPPPKQPPIRGGKARIEEALKQPTELELMETPLSEVVELIKDIHRIEIQIDKRALDDVGIAPDTLITKSLKGISLRSALNLILRDLDLTWIVKDEVLLITTSDAAESIRYLETYDVSDLIGLGDEKGGPAAAGKRLAETLAATMRRPDHAPPGQEAGQRKPAPKPATIACSTFGNVSLLSTTQNREGHEHIARWLADARGKLAEKQKAAAPKKKRSKPSPEAAILKALKKKVSVDYVKEPLEAVLRDLGEKFKINVQIDKKALDDVGISPDIPVTKRLKDVRLQSLLRLMLHELDLTYMIKEDVLLITTPEVADQLLTTVFYDVADLVVCRNKQGELWDDYASLADAITSTIRPATWDDAGGPGSIGGQTFGGGKVLIVSQTREVHEEIVDFLAQLRAVAQKNVNAPPPRRDPPPPKPPADNGLPRPPVPVVGGIY